MSTAENVKQQVLNYIRENIRERFPEVTDSMLIDNGAIYYMNGNDGTGFDFSMNDRTCEFVNMH